MDYEIQLELLGDWIYFGPASEKAVSESFMLRAVALRHQNGDIVYDLTF